MRLIAAIALFGVILTLNTPPARAGVSETTCAAGDAAAAQLKTPLVKSNDDAVALAKDYFRLATDQRDMFDKRKYAFETARNGEVWTTTIIFMRRPRYPWDDWKRRGKVGRITLCGLDGRLMAVEANY